MEKFALYIETYTMVKEAIFQIELSKSEHWAIWSRLHVVNKSPVLEIFKAQMYFPFEIVFIELCL